MKEIKSIRDINFKGRKVLLRADFNVPETESGEITDDTRIRESLPTIEKLLADGAAIIIMSHFGRPKNGFEEKYSLAPVAKHLAGLLNHEVIFTQELLGEKVTEIANNLKCGEIFLLENVRFYPDETKGDKEFAQELAKLGDCYINDAFGAAHRAHSSTATIAQFFPNDKYFGFLMEDEVKHLSLLMQNPQHPFTAIIGGSKISTKIDILENLIPKVDNMIIGGGMRYTFTKAMGGKIGKSLCEDDKLDEARLLMQKMKECNVNLYLPADSVVADDFSNDANTQIVPSDQIPDGWESLDCGPEAIKAFDEVISKSKTILWNGPMGVFEMPNFAKGTFAVGESVAKATANGAFSAVGGGDSVAAVKQLGIGDKMTYVSTGGGAMLEYLEGKELPGIVAIME